MAESEASKGGPGGPRLVLNAGSGASRPGGLHACFDPTDWQEVRLDIDRGTRPDIVGSVIDMRETFKDAVFDAIWSSHNLEHLHAHEVPRALAEFRRVLKPDGFALITCPDLDAVMRFAMDQGLDAKAYDAPVGPITAHDMLFGHGASIADGNLFMAHKTGFTRDRLGTLCLAAGFSEIRVGRGTAFDLWAMLLMPECSIATAYDRVRDTHLTFLFASELQ
jgi:SAM-dependent methyltransferase